MPIETISTEDQDHYRKIRGQDVTASVVGALFGLHPYETCAGLHMRVTGKAVAQDQPESEVMRRGNVLEPVVAWEANKLRPDWSLEKAREYLRDPELRLGATPDYYINTHSSRGILQTKTVGSRVYARDWADDVPPMWILLQVATEMLLSDAAFGAVAALVIGDYSFRCVVYDVPRHAGSERRLINTVKAFWEGVDKGLVPEIDFARDQALLSMLYPKEQPGKVADLRFDNRARELCDVIERCSETIKTASAERDLARAELTSKLGDAEAAIVPGYRVSWKLQTRHEHLVKASSYRVLRTRAEAAAT